MTTKNDKLNTDEHIHEEETLKDYGSRIITLDLEDGTQKDFIALDILSHNGENYIALSEVGSMEYDVLRFVEVDEDMELSIIEEDDEYEKVAELFSEHFAKMSIEDDDDEDDEDDDDDDDEEDEDDDDDEEDEDDDDDDNDDDEDDRK